MKIVRSTTWQDAFCDRIEGKNEWDRWIFYKMNYDIKKAHLVTDFHGLKALDYLPNLKPYPHQIEAAETAIEQMNGKAILADEVGLGKTIEAGLILKEYLIRGLVRKAIILTPASLVNQWVDELNHKFHIPAIAYRKNYRLDACQIVVMSIDMAKRQPHKERIYTEQYDMIIIDEAHKLKNHQTQNYQFVQGLKKKFCLLLTATPIQNNVYELFHLISLLKPGHLGSFQSFQEAFSKNKRHEEAEEFLHELINQVMVRNRREETGMTWTNRHVKIIPLQFSKEEREAYDMISSLGEISPIFTNAFSMITLQKEICSSKEATALTLSKMRRSCTTKEEVRKVEQVIEKVMSLERNAKAEKALSIIQKANGKVIIFTEYEASQLFLQSYLYKHGISSVPFNGRFSKSKRDWMKQLFEQKAQVLIATESGSEGINLQFCQQVINYDLPWNPMKLEQRIGRVHRIGQEKDVHVYNFAVQQTIEDHILKLLYEKIDVFERVVGELDDILSHVNEPSPPNSEII